MKGKDELEGTRSKFYPLAVRFWAPGWKPLGGLVQPPLGELGLNKMVREPNVSPHKQIIKDDNVKECISIE